MKNDQPMKPVQAAQGISGVFGVAGLVVILAVAGVASPPAFAQGSQESEERALFAHDSAGPAEASLPPVQTQGQAEFLSGGIGKDETDAIKQVAGSWPLMLEFAQLSGGHGEYISDAKVAIKDAAGATVVETVAQGPYMLVKLPPGKYTVEAVYQSETLRRQVTLQKGESRKVSLLWPGPRGQAGQAPAGSQGAQGGQGNQGGPGADAPNPSSQ